jgi:hypothetical protein
MLFSDFMVKGQYKITMVSNLVFNLIQKMETARQRWLIPVILATQEAEIRRILVQSQPWQIICETLSQKTPTHQKRAVEWLKVYALSSNPQYCQKKPGNNKVPSYHI